MAGFDSYPRCIVAYEHNHAGLGSRAVRKDLRVSSGEELLREAGVDTVDIVLGGPPCQSFSIRGKRLGLADSRGALVFDFARLVGEMRPTAFVFENVANLASMALRPTLDALLRSLAARGYTCTHGVLSAADFGVAQNRRRLFIIGNRSGIRLRLPTPTHSSEPVAGRYRHLGTSEVLDDLPDVSTPAAKRIANHEPTAHTPEMLAAFRRLQPGRRDPKSHHDRLRADRPGYTLRAGVGNFTPLRPIHYLYDRVLSVRESARLQGFPDTFIWPPGVPRLQQYRQVGNSVPPPLAAAIAAAVAAQLDLRVRPSKMAFPGMDRWVAWGPDDPGFDRQLSLLDVDEQHGQA